MVLRRASPAVIAACAAVAVAGSAQADKAPSIDKSKKLWATINVCDTKANPNGVGIRASMPGSGKTAEKMYIRLQLQYRSAQDGKWHNLGDIGDSGFISVGSNRYVTRETGRVFTIVPPKGASSTIRGAATFEWRRDGDVVRRARKRTTAGHKATEGADPKNHSAATCVVR